MPKKRGPVGAATDADLVGHIRRVLAESPFLGEGYRKLWARLRHQGVRTAAERVRRLMRENHLQAPRRGGNAHGPKAHDGTITTEVPDEMWGTDMTTTVTTGEGLAHVFVAVDHCTCECVGLHAAKGGNRFEALEPLRQGVREHFGRFEAKAAEGLTIRHDHGSNYLSDDFQRELKFLGMVSSPSLVREPEGNGCAERFIRTLKKEPATTSHRRSRCRRGYNRGDRVSVGLARPGPLLSGASRPRFRSRIMPDRPAPVPPAPETRSDRPDLGGRTCRPVIKKSCSDDSAGCSRSDSLDPTQERTGRMSRTDAASPFAHKIRPRHCDRLAIVYVRQSTPQQVIGNRESTDLQYQLRRRAVALGRADDRVMVIDDDQGISGTSVENRPGFQRLLAEVSLGHVGVVFGREMSRLSRSCKDWYQLVR